MEIMLRILSYFQFKVLLNLPGVKGLDVVAKGIQPYLILKPGLLLPPYCNEGKEACTLDKITGYNEGPKVELAILTDVDVSRTIELNIYVYRYPEIEVHEEKLRLLFQKLHRIRHLTIRHMETVSIMSVLGQVCFCLPYITHLHSSPHQFHDLNISSSSPTSTISLDAPLLEFASVSLQVLPVLINCSILNFVSRLNINIDHLGN